jgi:hypothetical protein
MYGPLALSFPPLSSSRPVPWEKKNSKPCPTVCLSCLRLPLYKEWHLYRIPQKHDKASSDIIFILFPFPVFPLACQL